MKVLDPNKPEIIENTTEVENFIRIGNLLRSEAEYMYNLFTKTKDYY